MAGIDYAHRAAEIIRDAGGTIVGRTRLQKVAFFLEAAGVGFGFPFRYKHFGPYSDLLAAATQHASALRLIRESESAGTWGLYSTYSLNVQLPLAPNATRAALARIMVNADAIELELAATAAYLALEQFPAPWAETARRKPEKADAGRLERARQLYQRLRQVPTPHPLPAI
jgi:uncharacterized protein YwgA